VRSQVEAQGRRLDARDSAIRLGPSQDRPTRATSSRGENGFVSSRPPRARGR
jgi:hypothetical protein